MSDGALAAAGKPGANVALDFEGNLLALLVPHGRRSILARDDDLIISLIDIQTWLLHLDAELAHHLRRLRLVLVCLHLALDLVRMEVPRLIGLCEGVVVRDAVAIVAEASEVRLRALLLFHGHCHDFDLVVGEANLNFKLWRHLELISLNGVVVVLLLLSNLVTFLHHLLFHLLLLLELLLRTRKRESDISMKAERLEVSARTNGFYFS